MGEEITGEDMRFVRGGLVAALTFVSAVVALLVSAGQAPQVDLMGELVGPCAAAPSGTVEVRADGELVARGAAGRWSPTSAGSCRAPVSVLDVGEHERYEVSAGALSGWVWRSEVASGLTVVELSGRGAQ